MSTTNTDEEFDEPGDDDRDRSNILFRAGYLRGLASKLPPGDDRTFLIRSARSLLAYAADQSELPQRRHEGY